MDLERYETPTGVVRIGIKSLKDDPNYGKCLRCYQYKTNLELDSDDFFPRVCGRCASVLHTMHYDVWVGNHLMLPHNLKGVTPQEFEERFVRERVEGSLKAWKRYNGFEETDL